MPLRMSREEVEAFKREYIRALEMEEARRAEERAKSLATAEMELNPEELQKEKERELEEVKREIEESFYKARGYKRYIDHRDRVLWLTPEEYEHRMSRRRRNSQKNGRDPVKVRWARTAVIYAAIALCAMFIGLLLTQ